MSYQVLARKWRPHSFDELMGQDHVRTALTNSLATGRLHHAYLFTGTRGVGKTTIARLMAKALNCEQGVSAEPCGQCSACVEIDEGRYLDLLEIDAASRTKVDDTRELLENVQYAPSRGRFKVYLIDEVHMFSKSSFNALLKTLEEPPEHVKFLLATTDPQKIPVTILSRCLQFNLRQMPTEVIEQQLHKIAGEETIEVEPEALRLIARSASGSMRDGLSLLDQAIAYSGSTLTLAETASMLGAVDHGQVVEMLQALHQGDANALLSQVDQLAARVPDYTAILEELLSLLHALSVRQQVEDAPVQVEVTDDRLAQLAEMIPAEELQLYYQLGLHGRRDLPLAPSPRTGLEMALLRMLAFQPERNQAPMAYQPPASSTAETAPPVPESPPVPTAAPTQRQQAPVEGGDGVGASAAGQVSEPPFESESPAAFVAMEPEYRDADDSPPTPPPMVAEQKSAESVGPGESTNRGGGHPLVGTPTKTEPPAVDWSQQAYALSLTGLVQQLAAQLVLVAVTENEYRFTLDPTHRAVLNRAAQSRLEQALSEHVGRSIKVVVDLASQSGDSPAKERQRLEQQRLEETTQKLREDPTVKALEGTFGAQIETASIQPPATD
ncbi:MAG: DNA polymerase III subunit gamma/tau [Gammaproteobacteria bacterium]